MKEVVDTTRQVVRRLETVLEILQGIQSTIPAPTPEEVSEIRAGRRPLTPNAYLLGLLQRAILGVENVASDLREIDLKTLRKVHEIKLSAVELNAIEEAVAERS